MRLIDGDELFGSISKQERWNVPDFVYESIKNAPTIEAELVRYSKWDAVDEDEFHYRCFSCGFNAYGNTIEVMDGTFRYCPHCGARMEAVE